METVLKQCAMTEILMAEGCAPITKLSLATSQGHIIMTNKRQSIEYRHKNSLTPNKIQSCCLGRKSYDHLLQLQGHCPLLSVWITMGICGSLWACVVKWITVLLVLIVMGMCGEVDNSTVSLDHYEHVW